MSRNSDCPCGCMQRAWQFLYTIKYRFFIMTTRPSTFNKKFSAVCSFLSDRIMSVIFVQFNLLRVFGNFAFPRRPLTYFNFNSLHWLCLFMNVIMFWGPLEILTVRVDACSGPDNFCIQSSIVSSSWQHVRPPLIRNSVLFVPFLAIVLCLLILWNFI